MTEPWWKRATVYQVYPRSFADSDGDGIGDLPGLISRLDYLERLGVDVVWVSPFLRSPQHDNGYDISDYRDVDPLFGTLGDVDELIAGLHARGMRFMMDVVVNHTSDQHPWFQASRRSRDDPRREWYWWRPPRLGAIAGQSGAEPTNWMSYFVEPSWTLDEATGEYYLHLFSRHQPDLNWENPDVRHEIYEMLRFWLDRGVDGLRMDVINMISKRLPLEDGPLRPGTSLGDGTAGFISGPRIHEYLRELHQQVIAGRDQVLITVGETPAVTLDEAVRFSDPERAELDMVFQFEHVGLDHGPGGVFDLGTLRVVELKESFDRWQRALAERGWNSLYWCNHDQPRAVSRFGSDDAEHRVASAKLLATVLHLQRGTPFIFQGEELGMTNFPFDSVEQFRDVESVNHRRFAVESGQGEAEILESLRQRSRDNARTPMQWTDGPQAGFSTATPWMPVNPNHRTINAESQIDDPDSVFSHYRRLIALRRELPVVAHGDFTMLLPAHDQIMAFARRHDDRELLVIANMSSRPAAASLDRAAAWSTSVRILCDEAESRTTPSEQLRLAPWEAQVYLRKVI
ncbi:MAG: alpha-glucosidase [Actinomycetota bacterium]